MGCRNPIFSCWPLSANNARTGTVKARDSPCCHNTSLACRSGWSGSRYQHTQSPSLLHQCFSYRKDPGRGWETWDIKTERSLVTNFAHQAHCVNTQINESNRSVRSPGRTFSPGKKKKIWTHLIRVYYLF